MTVRGDCQSVQLIKSSTAAAARNALRNRPGGAEGSRGSDDFWKRLWAIHCAPKGIREALFMQIKPQHFGGTKSAADARHEVGH